MTSLRQAPRGRESRIPGGELAFVRGHGPQPNARRAEFHRVNGVKNVS